MLTALQNLLKARLPRNSAFYSTTKCDCCRLLHQTATMDRERRTGQVTRYWVRWANDETAQLMFPNARQRNDDTLYIA